MIWYTEPDNFNCKRNNIKFGTQLKFIVYKLYIASHGGLPVRCKSINVKTKLK